MTIRTVLNPYGGIPPIVDARIGTAYAVVEICVLNLPTITDVANSVDELMIIYTNMPAIVQVGNNTANVNIVAANITAVSAVGENIDNVNAAGANIDAITAVNANMPPIEVVANDIANVNLVAERLAVELTVLVQDTAGAVEEEVVLAWPADVTPEQVVAFSVIVRGLDNWFYQPSLTTFIATLTPDGLYVEVAQDGVNLVGGTILWHITYTPTP
jgi:hypothetical protein